MVYGKYSQATIAEIDAFAGPGPYVEAKCCEACGATLTMCRGHARRYCSHRCRQRAYRKRCEGNAMQRFSAILEGYRLEAQCQKE